MIRLLQTSHDDKIYFSLAADQCAAICSSASLDVIEESKHHVGFLSDFFVCQKGNDGDCKKRKDSQDYYMFNLLLCILDQSPNPMISTQTSIF